MNANEPQPNYGTPQNQPPYPPQQPYGNQPQQPYYGQPHPVYGPPEQWGSPQAPKKSKLGWILGSLGIALTICTVLLFAGCSHLASEINGGDGSHKEKAAAMMAAADNVPESDWVSISRSDPKWEEGCLSIDTHCLKLSASWSVDHEVSTSEVAARMGLSEDDYKPGGYGSADCVKYEPYDGNSRSTVCVSGDQGSPGDYKVTINMTRK